MHAILLMLRTRDQCSIFSMVQQFCPDYRVLLALTQVACSYVLLFKHTAMFEEPYCWIFH